MEYRSRDTSDEEWLRGFGFVASRRFTAAVLVAAAVAAFIPPVIDLIEAERSTALRVIGTAGLVVTFTLALALVGVEMRGLSAGLPAAYRIPAVVGLSIGAALLVLMARDSNQTWVWSWPFATVLGAVAAPLPRPHRDVCAAVGVVGSAIVGWAVDGVGGAISSGIACACVVASRLLTVWGWGVTLQLARGRHTAADLAVAEERVRFAAELHDVQGHHLQVILLKAQLVERMVGRDDAAAQREAGEIRELATQALHDTRAVVHGYRRTSLATELANAAQILDAAGISTTVHGDADHVPEPLQELLGRLVREGTTNVLRHSRATHCVIDVRTDDLVGVRMSNDGADDTPTQSGSGLAGLRESFEAAGGELTTDRTPPDRFTVEANVHSGQTP